MSILQRLKLVLPVSFVLLLPHGVASTNFQACYDNFIKNSSSPGVVDINGNQITPETVNYAVGLTYQACLDRCGPDMEAFQFEQFSHQLTAWLLPWLALISQIPYGDSDALSNFEALIMTVGSPMLAAYSLTLAVTSSRWMVKRFRQSNHPRTFVAARVLNGLQQVSIKWPKEEDILPSLVVLRENDEWWKKLDEGLDYSERRWSLAVIMSMVYVALAFIFTWIVSLQGDLSAQLFANGQSIGSLWLVLLPIVVCYLQISPKTEGDRIRKAVEAADSSLFIATSAGEPERDSVSRGIEIQFAEREPAYEDRICPTPVCFYARFATWFRAARQIIDAFEAATIHSRDREKCGMKPRTKDEVIDWCKPSGGPGDHIYESFRIYVISSLLAFFLQWGTTCAAIVAIYLTPTRGFGCRSLSFLLYGVLATLVWVFAVASSVLMASCDDGIEVIEHSRPAKVTGALVVTFRQIAKFLAALNTAWILLSSLFQFSNIYDNCYCNASLPGLGDKAYAVLQLVGDEGGSTKLYWAAGMIMACLTALLFVCTITLLITRPERHGTK